MTTFSFLRRLGRMILNTILIVLVGVLASYYFRWHAGSPEKAQMAVGIAAVVAVIHFAYQVPKTFVILRLSQPQGIVDAIRILKGDSAYSKHMIALGLSWVAGDRFGADRRVTRAGRTARESSIRLWEEWLRINEGRLIWNDNLQRYIETPLLGRNNEQTDDAAS
jgi:hypothetical protein